jgi:thiamine biosynthesis protein ThiS
MPWSKEEGSMNITLNGEKKEIPDNITISGLLELLDIQQQRVAVELNSEIVKKDRYALTIINEGNVLEVVSFMAGGGRDSSKFIVQSSK